MAFEDGFGPLQTRLDALRMKIAHAAAVSGVNRGTLSQAASGQAPLSYPNYRRIEHILDVCESLQLRAPGVPIDWQNVTAVKKLIEDFERESRTPPGDLQQSDWNLLSLVISSEDPSMVTSNLGISPSELLKRLEETNRRFEGAIDSIRKANQDKSALTKIVNDELEAKRSQQ
jgi:transcriptional regulator with XRE-family HTH domain